VTPHVGAEPPALFGAEWLRTLVVTLFSV